MKSLGVYSIIDEDKGYAGVVAARSSRQAVDFAKETGELRAEATLQELDVDELVVAPGVMFEHYRE